ncbi:MAG: DUF1080 domain-containing protein [Prevotella sp.]|jgi:hypothetical protein|nr:DUF1080 domain-containing protein [Prevotella sp.]
MKKLIFFITICSLFFSCNNKGKDEANLILRTADWDLKNNARIQDSVLIITDKQSTAQFTKEYKNFELNLECKTAPNAIGGIWIHSDAVENAYPTIGYEVLINNNIERTDWRKSGSLSAVRNFGKRTVNNDEWFPVKIIVTGNQIKVYVNNVWVVDYTEPEKPFRTEEYAGRLFDKGLFTFVNYSEARIEYRNINIKVLSSDLRSDNPNDIDEQADDIIRLQQENYPSIDSHVHLKGWSKEEAAAMSRKVGITYGMAPNCGLKFPITSDQDIYNFLDTMKHQPFFLPMQAEGREWLDLFTEDAMTKFDYRFTDALTWTDDKGRRQRIWIKEETFVDDKQQFMNMLVDRAVKIISTEPVDIFVNPTFIPDALMPEYEALWTTERMDRIIQALKKANVALEINNRYKIPSARLIKQAKAGGVKFAFGTNNGDPDLGKLEYVIEMIRECQITQDDLFIPLSKNI